MGELDEARGRLTRADIDAIAGRVVELVAEFMTPGEARYVDAAELARILDVDRDWVYSHGTELGALRLGGPRGRLRFDMREVRRALAKRSGRPASSATSRNERGARFQRVPLLDFER